MGGSVSDDVTLPFIGGHLLLKTDARIYLSTMFLSHIEKQYADAMNLLS